MDREHYAAYYSYLDLGYIKNNYRELHYLYQTLNSLHEDFPAKESFDLTALQAAFFTKYPDADKGMYLELFKTLQETTLDPEVGVGILKAIKRRRQALNLSEASFKFSTGHAKLEDIADSYRELEFVDSKEDALYDGTDTDLEGILSSAILEPGLRWRLDCLNKSLGSIRPGDFGFLFKRPESGGTAFLASEVSHMLRQSDKPFLWFNNEEQDQKVILRVYQGFFGVTLEQIIANPKKYKEEFKAAVGDRLKFYGIEYSNKRDVEASIDKHDPALVVYDQLDAIKGFEADRNDLVLGEIYKWARGNSKRGHAAIGITQADGTADGQKWLTMNHVSEAKTTKQAAADFIIGMGMSYAEGDEYVRYLNLAKNKLTGDQDTISHLRHGHFQVLIQPEIMQFKDIVKY